MIGLIIITYIHIDWSNNSNSWRYSFCRYKYNDEEEWKDSEPPVKKIFCGKIAAYETKCMLSSFIEIIHNIVSTHTYQ